MSGHTGSSRAARRAMRMGLGAIALGAHLLAATSGAYASPVTYSFTTGDQPFNTCFNSGSGTFQQCSTQIYGSGTSVSGTFEYDPAALQSGSLPSTAAVYAGSFINLAGSTPSGFSDASGQTAVGNDILINGSASDSLVLAAESSVMGPFSVVPDNFVVFSIGGASSLRLVNVRLLWVEGILGAPDFLTDQNLPSTLPAFEGRLAMDFADASSSSAIVAIVFFDGLFVHSQAVPEPASAAMLGAAALTLGMWRRRSASRP